jgi:hypothetical protein
MALWLLFVFSCAIQGPSLIHSLTPRPKEVHDFYQEWSSARNWARGRPIYTPISETIGDYLRLRLKAGAQLTWNINVHPPSAVLLAIPFQGVDYATAKVVWTALSLASIVLACVVTSRAGGLHWSASSWLGLAAGLMWFDPFHQQLVQGQLTAVLLLLTTLGWAAGKSGRDSWAGVCFGLATTIKLFPGFLVLWLIGTRKWTGVVAWAVTVATITALTTAVLGPQTYLDYVQTVLPEAALWRGAASNVSVSGFWCKVFAPTGHYGPSTPLVDNPTIANVGTALSLIAVVALVLWRNWCVRDATDADRAWCLTLCGMLLASPVSWDHYFLLLLPAFVLLRKESLSHGETLIYWGGLVVFALPMLTLAATLYPHSPAAMGPRDTLLFCELQFYALLVWFAWMLSMGDRPSNDCAT